MQVPQAMSSHRLSSLEEEETVAKLQAVRTIERVVFETCIFEIYCLNGLCDNIVGEYRVLELFAVWVMEVSDWGHFDACLQSLNTSMVHELIHSLKFIEFLLSKERSYCIDSSIGDEKSVSDVTTA